MNPEIIKKFDLEELEGFKINENQCYRIFGKYILHEFKAKTPSGFITSFRIYGTYYLKSTVVSEEMLLNLEATTIYKLLKSKLI